MRWTFLLLSFFIFLNVSFCIAAEVPAPQNFIQNFNSTPPPPPDWNFEVPRYASRTSGVAPLSVFFSAGLERSSATTRTFHHYEYSWNFNDADSGVWGTTGADKNTAKGPVTSHVFERGGTYNVTLAVRNSSGTIIDTETFTIDVTDPDEYYSGTNTTCITSTDNNDFTGCPSGANHVTTSNLTTITSYAGAGRRILFRRGSSWNLSSSTSFPSNSGPVSIGAYGTCTNPDAQGLCSNAPTINISNSSNFID